MRILPGAAVLACGLAVAAAALARPADGKPPADPAAVARLVKQLGSDSFEEREQASRDLEKLGPAALDALRAAVKDGEPEVQLRAQALLRKAEDKEQAARRQAEAARILAPKMVRLSFKQTPLPDALADFVKQSGYALHLHDPDGKLAGKKVTLDTGEVAFWEAFDRFCAAAGLVEAGSRDLFSRPGAAGAAGAAGEVEIPVLPAQPRPRRQPGVNLVPQPLPPPPVPDIPAPPPAPAAPGALAVAVAVAQPAAAVQPAPPAAAAAAAAAVPIVATPGTFVLTAGTPPALPTCYAGAARIRALPARDVPLPASAAGEAVLPLEVRLEPRAQLQAVAAVRITRALDDQGQKLDQLADPNPDAAPAAAPAAAPGVIVVPLQPAAAVPGPAGSAQVVPVRLKKGPREAKTLKELTGTLTLQVVLPPEPVITVDKVLKAQGETVKGKDGGFIKITELTRTDDSLTVRLEMEPPPGLQAPGAAFRRGGFRMRPFRPFPVPLPAPAPNNFKGGAFQVQVQPLPAQVLPAQAQVQVQIAGNGNVVFAAAGLAGSTSLTLEDDKGQKITPNRTQSSMRVVNGQASYEQVLGFPLLKGQEPARLIWSGSRVPEVEVPFTLKDVPLP